MLKPTSFHVRHDLQPVLTYELLNLFLSKPEGQTQEELEHSANIYGFRLRERKDYSKLIKSLMELDVLREEDDRFLLTDKGEIISRLIIYQRDLLAEFIHFLYYSSFDLEPNKRFSWSYRTVCDALWLSAPSVINRDSLVNHVTREAVTIFEENGISFSASSVSGVINWLVELIPNCVVVHGTEQQFVRREYCSIELFTLALNHEYRRKSAVDLAYVTIDSSFREEICRLCLINPDKFSEMLSLAEASFNCVDVRRERGDKISMSKFEWNSLEN
ncbi:MAG: hypothetical protein JNM46_00270 [Anaerolineales bacterium]|nr:hypothetical protein [Anaerolineales bacterium]